MSLPYFDSRLRVEETGEYKNGVPIWITLRDLTLVCELEGERRAFTVPAGFRTDYASIPRFFWRVFPPSGRYNRAAVVHDWLYIGKRGDREQADRVFFEGMKALGVPAWKRSLMHRAVRLFGGRGWGR